VTKPEAVSTLDVPVEVQIDALTLNGFHNFDVERFDAALHAELTRLVAGGVLAALASPSAWHVEHIQIDTLPSVDSALVGAEVARAIFAQISGVVE
jgi:hypothetical protein